MAQEGKPFSAAFSKLANAKTGEEKVEAAQDVAKAAAGFARPAAMGALKQAQANAANAAPAQTGQGFARPSGLGAVKQAQANAAKPAPAQAAAAPKAPAGAAPAAAGVKPGQGFVRPAAQGTVKPAAAPAPAPAPKAAAPQKSIDEIAKEVIKGNYGNGEERKKKLAAAGYDYAAVQKRVNEMLKA